MSKYTHRYIFTKVKELKNKYQKTNNVIVVKKNIVEIYF